MSDVDALYDRIGQGYRDLRRPDPRIARKILRALGDASTVVNVGAGTGSYEPRDRTVVAVEPSMTMIRQRDADAAPVVQATAIALPFKDGAFDAGLAILTLHHWPRWDVGLRELRRVSRRVVILTWDPASPGFWLTDYFPESLEIDRRIFPSLRELESELGVLTVEKIPIPHDCTDGFFGAYWRRPAAYLDERVRSAISTFSKLTRLASGLEHLRRDLGSGAWQRRHGRLSAMAELDLGYRLIVAGPYPVQSIP